MVCIKKNGTVKRYCLKRKNNSSISRYYLSGKGEDFFDIGGFEPATEIDSSNYSKKLDYGQISSNSVPYYVLTPSATNQYIRYSTNGISWTAKNKIGKKLCKIFCATHPNSTGRWVILCQDGYVSENSTDPTGTWSSPSKNNNIYLSDDYWNDVTYDGSKYVALSKHGRIATYQYNNGSFSWSQAQQVLPDTFLSSGGRMMSIEDMEGIGITYANGKYVVILVEYSQASFPIPSIVFVGTSTDLYNWTTSNFIDIPVLAGIMCYGITYIAGKFYINCYDHNNGLIYLSSSQDGLNWSTPVHFGSDIFSGGNYFYVFECLGRNVFAITDGTEIAKASMGTIRPIYN